MKTQPICRLAVLLLLSLSFQVTYALSGGNIMGKVTDTDSDKPIDGATVLLESQGLERVYFTNESGYFYASNIPAGVYNITVSYLLNKKTVEGIKINNDETKEINFTLSTIKMFPDVVVGPPPPPVIDITKFDQETLTREVFTQQPVQVPTDITGNLAGVVAFNGEYYVRGARAGSLAYYIDGARVMGNPDIPLRGLDLYRSYTGFVPPRYGDCTGGVVVMETRNYFGE